MQTMKKFLVILCILGGVAAGAIAPIADGTNQPPQKRQISDAPSSSIQNPVFNQNQGNQGAPIYYPTYPEYQPNTGLAVQSGYEGYLVPSTQVQRTSDWPSGVLSALIPLSSFALAYGAKAGTYLISLFLMVILGAALTTAVCTFTPVCSISFIGLGLTKNLVREQVTELARAYITPESLNTATVLVQKAIDKYANLQRTQREKGERNLRESETEN